MLTALIRNWRHSAELLILAPTLEVAKNAWQPMVDMVRADPLLWDLLHIQENFRQIKHRRTGAVLKVVAADTDTVGGKKAAFVLVDELWIFGKREKSDAMLMEATGGLVARPEGFVIYLSTQSDEPPAGVFKEKLDLYRDIRDGKIIDNKKLGILYEYPAALLKREAYLDPEFFYVTNPNLGRSVSLEWLEDEFAAAQRKGIKSRNIFLAKHLNVEIGMNLRANRWPGAEYWKRREDPSITCLEELYDRCEVIVPGVDGGGLDDLFGFTALGREREPTELRVKGEIVLVKRWLGWSHGWCHKGVLERRQSIASVLLDFEKAGDLTIVDDELEDISSIIAIIAEIKRRALLAAVAVDPAGLGEFVDALAAPEVDITVENKQVIGVPQGYAMMNAIKTTERKLANGSLRHAPCGLMAWCVGNLKIEATATAIRTTKVNAGDAKIDLAMSMFDAAYCMATNPQPVQASYLASGDLLVL